MVVDVVNGSPAALTLPRLYPGMRIIAVNGERLFGAGAVATRATELAASHGWCVLMVDDSAITGSPRRRQRRSARLTPLGRVAIAAHRVLDAGSVRAARWRRRAKASDDSEPALQAQRRWHAIARRARLVSGGPFGLRLQPAAQHTSALFDETGEPPRVDAEPLDRIQLPASARKGLQRVVRSAAEMASAASVAASVDGEAASHANGWTLDAWIESLEPHRIVSRALRSLLQAHITELNAALPADGGKPVAYDAAFEYHLVHLLGMLPPEGGGTRDLLHSLCTHPDVGVALADLLLDGARMVGHSPLHTASKAVVVGDDVTSNGRRLRQLNSRGVRQPAEPAKPSRGGAGRNQAKGRSAAKSGSAAHGDAEATSSADGKGSRETKGGAPRKPATRAEAGAIVAKVAGELHSAHEKTEETSAALTEQQAALDMMTRDAEVALQAQIDDSHASRVAELDEEIGEIEATIEQRTTALKESMRQAAEVGASGTPRSKGSSERQTREVAAEIATLRARARRVEEEKARLEAEKADLQREARKVIHPHVHELSVLTTALGARLADAFVGTAMTFPRRRTPSSVCVCARALQAIEARKKEAAKMIRALEREKRSRQAETRALSDELCVPTCAVPRCTSRPMPGLAHV